MHAGGTARSLINDVLIDIVKFPVWWYTRGLAQAVRRTGQQMQDAANRLSLRILFRSLLKPMYGDYSRSGRAISFFLRIIVFAFKAVWMAIWIIILVGMLLVWVAAPAAVFGLFLHAL